LLLDFADAACVCACGGTVHRPSGRQLEQSGQRNDHKHCLGSDGAAPVGEEARSKAFSPGFNREHCSIRRHETVAPLNDATVRFRSTGTQLKTREIANLFVAPSDPDNARVFTILKTVLQEFDKGARAAGKPNDLALALSFFLATNASVYHDGGEPADPQMMELRDTIASALVEGNALNGVTDRQKQEMYETLVLYTGLALAGYTEAKQGGDAASQKIYQQLAGMNLQAVTGISPDKITFTDQGLNIEREPGEADTSVAPDPTPAASENSDRGAIDYNVIARAYEDNEVGAEARYGGRRIRVSGRVNSVLIQNGKIQVQFVTPMARHIIFNCYFPMSRKSSVANLQRDQVIVVEGIIRGSEYTGIMMEDCILR
jgi:hypothetical protein